MNKIAIWPMTAVTAAGLMFGHHSPVVPTVAASVVVPASSTVTTSRLSAGGSPTSYSGTSTSLPWSTGSLATTSLVSNLAAR